MTQPLLEQIEGVPIFQLIQWKHAIKLERLGLRNSRGSVYAHAKRVLGITGNRDKVIKHIQDMLDSVKDNGS